MDEQIGEDDNLALFQLGTDHRTVLLMIDHAEARLFVVASTGQVAALMGAADEPHATIAFIDSRER